MAQNELQWFTGSGGPQLLLPEELLEEWSGVDSPRNGRVVKTKGKWDEDAPATDYDRACDVEELIECVEVGAGHGIVLGGEPHPTAFLPRPNGGLLVRWVQGRTEREVLEALGRIDADDDGTPAFIEARPGPLLLFDAACPGGEVEEDRVVLDLHPGRYVAGASTVQTGDVELIVIKLDRVG